MLAAVKKEHAQASAAKAGAEKALAEKKAPLDAAIARAKALDRRDRGPRRRAETIDATAGQGWAGVGGAERDSEVGRFRPKRRGPFSIY